MILDLKVQLAKSKLFLRERLTRVVLFKKGKHKMKLSRVKFIIQNKNTNHENDFGTTATSKYSFILNDE